MENEAVVKIDRTQGNIMSEFLVSCAAGFEKLVVEEVILFGGENVCSSTGIVTWAGSLETGYRCCLWSRFASRVFLVLDTFPLENTEMLYEKALTFPWQDHLSLSSSFAVSCTLSAKAVISHSRYAALRVKDGLVDAFRNRTGDRPSVKPQKPDVQFHLHVDADSAQLFVDLSGDSLHRRGYRVATGVAPLKETLAAAIVALSGWPKDPGPLVDPMCGSGTLLIEAALMYGDSAPGLSRDYFGFLGWPGHSEKLWDDLVAEALERENAGAAKNFPLLLGYDCDPVAVSSARKNIQRAGLEEVIQVKLAELGALRPAASKGMVLSNLPYGERLSEREAVAMLYSGMGRILRHRFPGWSCGVLISNPELTDSFGLRWEHKHRLFNGSIACSLLCGGVDPAEQAFTWNLPEGAAPVTNEFENRLRKNLKKILKWATRENVACFRVYDRDLPDYNFTVDFYSKWVHIQEYAPPKTVDPQIAASRLEHGIRTVKDLLGVRSNRVFVKTRERQRGKKQYEKKSNKKKMYTVQEREAAFLVNFSDYLDTGLFLDHRPLRQQIEKTANGKRFLNLFGYTGTATIQAALGGAEQTTTIDLSANYVNWAQMNLSLNGFSPLRHRVEQADCMQWLAESDDTFDMIFIDPPTFSNTKKSKLVFDIQKDHTRLLTLAMHRLDHAGVLYFSTNFNRFKLDEGLGKSYNVKNISRETIPHDFSRNSKVHYCWEIQHRPRE